MDKIKILIIEDEEELSRILSDKLTENGFEIYSAKNGQEGLDIINPIKPNLILIDILMPVMDGMTVLKKLRQDYGEYGKSVPVIMLTNLNDSKNITESLEQKVSHYWVKSDWKIDDLIKEVKDIVEVTTKT